MRRGLTMTSSTQPSVEDILKDLLNAWNAHDAVRVSTFYTGDYIGVDLSCTEQQSGPEGVCATAQRYLDAFPDLMITAEEMIANEDQVAVKVQVNGTQRGMIMNIPATA